MIYLIFLFSVFWAALSTGVMVANDPEFGTASDKRYIGTMVFGVIFGTITRFSVLYLLYILLRWLIN